MRLKGGSIWGGYLAPWEKIVYGITIGQKYLMENTTLGIPALFQTEGMRTELRTELLSHVEMQVCMDSRTTALSGHHPLAWPHLSIQVYYSKPRQRSLMRPRVSAIRTSLLQCSIFLGSFAGVESKKTLVKILSCVYSMYRIDVSCIFTCH